MADEKDIRIRIIVDTKDAKKLEEVKKALDNVGKTSKNSSEDTKQALKVVSSDVDKTSKIARDFAKNWDVDFETARSAVSRFGAGNQQYTKEISHDTSQLGQTSRDFAKNWNTSIESARNFISGLGKETENVTSQVSHDTSQLGQASRDFAKNWNVPIESARTFISSLGKETKNVTSVISHDVDQTSKVARKFANNWDVDFATARSAVERFGVGNQQYTKQISHDTSQLGQTSRDFAKNWNVSIDSARNFISGLGKETKNVSSVVNHDVDSISKTARTFAKNWNVDFKSARTHIENLQAATKTGSEQMGFHLTFIAWHFRYLGNIFDKVSQSLVKGMKDVIGVASELQESFLSIGVAAAMYGQEADKATALAEKLAFTGLLPLKEAMGSVQNLMLTKMGFPEMERLLYRALDVAFLYESGVDGMQAALEGLTKSILRGQTVLAKNVTLRTLWTETERRLKDTIGLTLKELTKRQRALEVLKTIEMEYGATLGLHKMESDTARGALNKLNTAFTVMKNTIGTALIPLLDAFTRLMVKASGYITGFVDAVGPTVPIVMALAIAISFFVAKVSFAIGVIISLSQVVKGLSMQFGFAAISAWKIVLPLIAIGAVLGGGIYLWLKYSGALDKAKNSASKFADQLAALKDKVDAATGGDDDAISADEDRRIQHERNTQDIIEDIEREKSKGLWANQIAIKDLEKRLKRENEDWARYSKKQGVIAGEGGGGLFDNLLDGIGDVSAGIDSETKKITGFFNRLKDPDMWASIGSAIYGFTDNIKNTVSDIIFWKEFFKALAENMGKAIVGVGDIIGAAFEGLFGSVMKGVAVAAALTFTTVFGIALLKSFSAGGVGFVAATSAGAAVTGALAAAIPSTIAITVTLLTLEALRQAIKFRTDVNSVWNSVGDSIKANSDLLDIYFQQYKDGKITIEELVRKTDDLTENTKDAWQSGKEFNALPWTNTTNAIKNIGEGFGDIVDNLIFGIGSTTGRWIDQGVGKLFGFGGSHQFGGIIPGMRNQPIPILAHGGERIIPAGEVNGGGGNITVNINSPVVRENEDINRIVRAVSHALGQKTRFARMGAY